MKSSTTKKAGTVLMFLADLVITSFCNVWMWNNIVARMFQIPEITIMQGWVLSLAIIYFFQSRQKEKDDDYFEILLDDTIYTLVIWLISFVITIFAF